MSAEHTHGRTLTMYGTAKARSRVLVAGCVNGTTCAGTDVVNADLMGCPPPDAELWHFATLDPNGADLDATPAHPGAHAFRQAVADLRPKIAIVFRTGTEPSRLRRRPEHEPGPPLRPHRPPAVQRDPERGPRGLGRDGAPRHRRDHRRTAARPGLKAPGDTDRVRDRPPRRDPLRRGRLRRPPPHDRVRPRPARLSALNWHSFVTFACCLLSGPRPSVVDMSNQDPAKASDTALQGALTQIERQFGKGTVMRMGIPGLR